MKRRNGFTLIELLTVIAIIAILAAILFPVFQRAKVAARRGADISNMASLAAALRLYREDQGGYPPLLLQVAEYDRNNMLRRVDQLRRAYLFRQRVKDINAFTSVMNDAAKNQLVTAFWPNRDRRPLDPNEACEQRQIYGFELMGDPCSATAAGTAAALGPDPVLYNQIGVNPAGLNGDPPDGVARFYAWDSYDLALVKNPDSATVRAQPEIYELRYTLFWTLSGQLGGGPNDNPRQLGYNDPPEDTVVTWNTYFRQWQDDPDDPANLRKIPKRYTDDVVLFLSGNARPAGSRDVYERSWRYGQ